MIINLGISCPEHIYTGTPGLKQADSKVILGSISGSHKILAFNWLI
jgi:hypothetical protein